MSERITKEQADAADLIVNEAVDEGGWINTADYGINKVLLDGAFTTEQLEAIVIAKRYEDQCRQDGEKHDG